MREQIDFPGFNRLILPILLAVATTVASDGVLAADAATRWVCRYSRDMTIACDLKNAPAASALDEPETAAFTAGGGTAPADARVGRLPPVMQIIRGRPGALAGKQVRIPLHTDATDMPFVRQLAQAVMCGSRAGCSVEFEPTMVELAKLSSADLADRTDAALEE